MNRFLQNLMGYGSPVFRNDERWAEARAAAFLAPAPFGSPMNDLRFGAARPKTLILGLHGGFQTTETEAWWSYLDFRRMSNLEALADESTTVVLPQAPRRIWGLYLGKDTRDVRRLQEIVDAVKPARVIACGFSEGATALIHYTRLMRFDGIVSCSAVVPPFDGWRTGEHRWCPAMFWAGASEKQNNRTAAETYEKRWKAAGQKTARDLYPPAGHNHRWPAEWNDRIKPFFEF